MPAIDTPAAAGVSLRRNIMSSPTLVLGHCTLTRELATVNECDLRTTKRRTGSGAPRGSGQRLRGSPSRAGSATWPRQEDVIATHRAHGLAAVALHRHSPVAPGGWLRAHAAVLGDEP